MVRMFVAFFAVGILLGCGLLYAVWPPEDGGGAHAAPSARQLEAAYDRVRPGITPESGLAALGLDSAQARKLSYLGALEMFLPRDAAAFDTLDPAMQRCFQTQGRCTAMIFSAAPEARVVLLIEGGRVAYKAISGGGRDAQTAAVE
jgi:hypothetical protein